MPAALAQRVVEGRKREPRHLGCYTMVRSPEGMVMPFNLAKAQGFLPPVMEFEELW